MGIGVNVNAQSDGFFRYQYEYRDGWDQEWNELILLPSEHGLDYNYHADSAPLTSGLLMMVCMGIGYCVSKSKNYK